MRALGLSTRGMNYVRVRDRIEALGYDTSHFNSTRGASHLDDRLRELVPRCSRLEELLRALDVPPAEAVRVRRRLNILGLSTSHFLPPTRRRDAGFRWSDDELRAAVASTASYAATLRALGLVPAGGNYDALHRRIQELGLDISHFRGQAWNRGMRGARPPLPLAELLVAGRWTTSQSLKQRLIREGLKCERCEACGWAERRPLDGVIPVELDHVNGDKNDNRIENLRVLCPNCHALQPTHRGLNRKSRRA